MRGLAGGEEKEFKKYRKLLLENFVFLNVFTKSVKDEHEPRGPEGPYRFVDRSVPVYVIKSFQGETYVQQLGFVAGTKPGLRQLSRHIDSALKQNGPVQPPKQLRPLVKNFEKGLAYLEKKRPGYAWKEFEKVVEAGTNTKKFPKGEPAVTRKARARMAAIEKEAAAKLDEAEKLDEAKDKKKALRRVLRAYGKIPKVAERARAALKEL